MRRPAVLALVVVLLLVVGVPVALAAEDTALAALPSWMQWAMGIGSALGAVAFGGWRAWARAAKATTEAPPAPAHVPHPLHLEHAVRREDRVMTQADLDAFREEVKDLMDTRLELHEQHVERAEVAATRALTAAAQVQGSANQVLAALKIATPSVTPGDHQ